MEITGIDVLLGVAYGLILIVLAVLIANGIYWIITTRKNNRNLNIALTEARVDIQLLTAGRGNRARGTVNNVSDERAQSIREVDLAAAEMRSGNMVFSGIDACIDSAIALGPSFKETNKWSGNTNPKRGEN